MTQQASFDFEAVGFSSQERRTLLEEIGLLCLLLGRSLSPLSLKSEHKRSQELLSLLERIRILEKVVPLVSALTPAYLAKPLTTLTEEEVTIPLTKSRGGKKTVQSLVRKQAGADPFDLASFQNLRVKESVRQVQSDALPLLFLALFIEALRQECLELLAVVQFCGEEREVLLLEDLNALCTELAQIRPLPLLLGCKDDLRVVRDRLLTLRSVGNHTLLLDAYEIFASGLRLDFGASPLLQDWEQEPWRLYEVWCYLTVVKTLCALGWEPLEGRGLRLTERGLSLELAKGKESEILFRRNGKVIRLLYQPYFPSANWQGQGVGFRSKTHAMQPDIGIESGGRWLLFDSKCKPYSRPQSEQDDINKMHTYRDAIVREERQVVEGAWCLYPGGGEQSHKVYAYPASSKEQLFGTAGVGAIFLRPASSQSLLTTFLGRELERLGSTLNSR